MRSFCRLKFELVRADPCAELFEWACREPLSSSTQPWMEQVLDRADGIGLLRQNLNGLSFAFHDAASVAVGRLVGNPVQGLVVLMMPFVYAPHTVTFLFSLSWQSLRIKVQAATREARRQGLRLQFEDFGRVLRLEWH